MKSFVRVVLIAALCGLPALAQFTSGSTGTDGALDYTGKCPGNKVTFNPASFTPPLDPAHDNIFNFTTITIPANCEVDFIQSVLPGPVIWLATGNVTLGGGAVLNLVGASGGANFPTSLRVLATPGSGGYPGGAAGSGTSAPGPGFGPGGGAAASGSISAGSGKYTGNQFAIPLVGGSGGGGGSTTGGGAGGGAILIASSTSINTSIAYIEADGGNGGGSCPSAGGGSGGAVRLVAPSVAAGTITARGGNGNCSGGGSGGAIRIESFNNPGGSLIVNGGSGGTGGAITYGSPYNTFVTSSVVPTLQVVSVGGMAVTSPSTGSFTVPDVMINTGAPVTIQLQGMQIPIGTTATLIFYSDNGPDATVTSTAFAGTLASSTATASFAFPPGYTRGYVYATFTP